MIAVMGKQRITVIMIPIRPAQKPTIRVSALNTRETSFLDAPIARRIPISFVLSSTEIFVIIPILVPAARFRRAFARYNKIRAIIKRF